MDVASYRREAFLTYGSYNSKELSKESLAEGGFLYTNTSDRVKCKWCNLILDEWDSSDNPFEEHEARCPDCPFILAVLSQYRSAPYGAPENCGPSKTPSTEEERLETFKNWPHVTPRPQELAQAGFYYTGDSDKALCAHCGLGCNEWEPDDNPWIEHQRFSPNCRFLKTGPSLDYLQALAKPKPDHPVVNYPCGHLSESFVEGKECTICGVSAEASISIHVP